MKNKLLAVAIFISAVLFSCKDDKKADAAAEAPKEPNGFTVTMGLVVPEDDNFQIYYNEDGTDVFTGDKHVDVDIKGSNAAQEVKFVLPEDVVPTSLRFDMGSNKNQKDVKIVDFKMKYFDKNFVAKDTLFVYYFGNNQQIDYNRKEAIAKPKPLPNETYDPIFTGTDMLKAEIQKLVK